MSVSYSLISGQVIPAITGGVFDYAKLLSVEEGLLIPPAYILASYIIAESIGSMTDPIEGDDWPLYVSYMADEGAGVEKNCGAVYDTSGIKDAKISTGEVVVHEGVQILIRSADYVTGYTKAETIALALDAVLNAEITIGSCDYKIISMSRQGPPTYLGLEKGTKGLRLFSVNFLMTIERI